jgi:hypothetical protein
MRKVYKERGENKRRGEGGMVFDLLLNLFFIHKLALKVLNIGLAISINVSFKCIPCFDIS